MSIRFCLPIACASLLAASALSAQDVEMLGRIYGTRPPQAYFDLKARDPGAFQFERAWSRRGLGGQPGGTGTGRPALILDSATPAGSGPLAALGQRAGSVRGTFRFPLILGLFSDSPAPPFAREEIQREFFDGPNSRVGTITEYYAEVSGGRVNLVGETQEWIRTTLTQAQVAGGVSGLSGSARVGEYFLQILSRLQGIDWGRYDNDGPDGLPNSGDDDGFVDVLAVMHPSPGAECGGAEKLNRIWSHRWSLQDAAGQDFVTSTPARSGGFIRVNDYTVQPLFSCAGNAVENRVISEIGVFAHELGHGFGLPDLYCTTSNCSMAGSGRWDLMASGSWGCGANEPARPCHMSAWAKAVLGWAEIETLPRDRDLGTLRLPPVEKSGKMYRIDAGDGSGEFFLLENRQRIGFDQNLRSPGLLVWHVDQQWVASRWGWNGVNATSNHLGVWLRQADGLDQLTLGSGGNAGDAGDPFPGSTGNTVFHAGRAPHSLTHRGDGAGVTLLDITQVGEDITFRALTRYQQIRLRTTGSQGSAALFTVDGTPSAGNEVVVRSAPFQTRQIVAAPGEPISEGVRRGFARWIDDGSAPRVRSFTTGLEDVDLVAEYGPRQLRVTMSRAGDTLGITAGVVKTSPASEDFWFAEGTDVVFMAEPAKGFTFAEWRGALAGQANPAIRRIGAPADATAVFRTGFVTDAQASHRAFAASDLSLTLAAVNGNEPYTWFLESGRVPDGVVFKENGTLEGAPMETGSFPLDIRVRDALGLSARGRLVLEVDPPALGLDALTGPFLLGPLSLSDLQRRYLDQAGNRNGGYDLGDFRAWMLANPNAPMTVAQKALVEALVPMFDLAGGGGR